MARKVSLVAPCERCGKVAYWRVLNDTGGDVGAFCSEHADAAVARLEREEAKAKRVARDGR